MEGSPSQAYGARLESVLGFTALGGSNPPPSASIAAAGMTAAGR
jgi:hypothetical protein